MTVYLYHKWIRCKQKQSILHKFFVTRKAIGFIINTFYFNLFDTSSSIVSIQERRESRFQHRNLLKTLILDAQHKQVFPLSTTISFSLK